MALSLLTGIGHESFCHTKKTNNLIEELLETMAILADKNALTALKESAVDKKSGRTQPLQKFLVKTHVLEI